MHEYGQRQFGSRISVAVLQTDLTLQVLSWTSTYKVTLSSCFHFTPTVQCRETRGLLGTVVRDVSVCSEDGLWQPSFLGQKVVVLSSTPGFWDLDQTKSAIYDMLFFGWDVVDLGSWLQISLNYLKTDEDRQCFLASIHSLTQCDCNIPSGHRNRMSCCSLFYQSLLPTS